MTFDDITLPQALITELYKNSLVGPIASNHKPAAEKVPVVKNDSSTLLKFLGKNLKQVTVLVHCQDDVYLPDNELEFLSKILKACRLDLGDIAIINTANLEVTQEHLHTLEARFLLIFGDCTTNFPGNSNSEHFTPTTAGGISIMTAPGLDKLSQNTTQSKQLKGKLWTSLQQFFQL